MGIFLNEHSLGQEVLKHGSHNQLSHGRRGGGKGGSGGGSSQVDAKESKQVQQTAMSAIGKWEEAIDSSKKDVQDFIDESQSTGESKKFENVKTTLESSLKDFTEAKSLTGDKQKTKLQSAYNKYELSMNKLDKIKDYSSSTKMSWILQGMSDAIPGDEMMELGLDGIWDQ